jgi:hypothetical protein
VPAAQFSAAEAGREQPFRGDQAISLRDVGKDATIAVAGLDLRYSGGLELEPFVGVGG